MNARMIHHHSRHGSTFELPGGYDDKSVNKLFNDAVRWLLENIGPRGHGWRVDSTRILLDVRCDHYLNGYFTIYEEEQAFAFKMRFC